MPIRIHTRHRRGSGLVAPAALIAACALALAGCGDGGGASTKGAGTATAATATATATPSSSPTPEASPTPSAVTMSDQTGAVLGSAIAVADGKGLDYAVYLQGTGLSLAGGGKQASSYGPSEEVCEQVDDSADTNPSFDVAFTIPRDGRDCAGRLLHTPKPTPKPTPEPSKTRADGTGGTSGGGGTGGGSGGGSGACELMSPAGNCYADGQFCAKKHRGLSTHGRGGEYLTCERDSGGRWRWSDGVPG
ncbi:hypothetical protein ACWDF1_21050 [Streptomyces coelicoflavus]|uniref:hypothetical protein n=1 Tax=Streptomyces coelicoflavus TaxID=285562 RepID=UPI0036C19EBA